MNEWKRVRKMLLRLVRDQRVAFLIVGGINTVLGFGLFAAFTIWVFPDVYLGYILSLVVSYAIAVMVAFVLYRRFVFRVTGHVVRDFLRFIAVYIVSISINLVALPVLVELVGIAPILAQVIILVMTTAVSFVGHRSFSFRRAAPSGLEAPRPSV
jgi:putative flippase GtrA